MTIPINLMLTWPQAFALFLMAIAGAFLAEWLVGNTPKFGLLGSLVLGIVGGWLFANLPFNFPLEPRLEDLPVVRSIIGSLLLVAIFAYFRRQGATR